MTAPSPAGGALTAQYPQDVVEPGYLRLSGTSFAAPVVAGVAAQVLARHPLWTPDQVKGALMQTTQQVAAGTPSAAAGAGELDGAAAAEVSDPINPNAAIDGYLGQDSSGRTVFDGERWSHAVRNQGDAWAAASAAQAWGSASASAWGSYAWWSLCKCAAWPRDDGGASATGAASASGA